jgi:hypothetical protein
MLDISVLAIHFTIIKIEQMINKNDLIESWVDEMKLWLESLCNSFFFNDQWVFDVKVWTNNVEDMIDFKALIAFDQFSHWVLIFLLDKA